MDTCERSCGRAECKTHGNIERCVIGMVGAPARREHGSGARDGRTCAGAAAAGGDWRRGRADADGETQRRGAEQALGKRASEGRRRRRGGRGSARSIQCPLTQAANADAGRRREGRRSHVHPPNAREDRRGRDRTLTSSSADAPATDQCCCVLLRPTGVPPKLPLSFSAYWFRIMLAGLL